MASVTIKREFEFPPFGAGKWAKADHERPLRLKVDVATAHLYLDDDGRTPSGVIVFPQGRIELIYNPAPDLLLRGLRTRGSTSATAAQTIYDAYADAHKKFSALLYSTGQVRYVYPSGPTSMYRFFDASDTILGRAVEWRIDNSSWQRFEPRLPKPRGINPMFKADQLVTPTRWSAMQRAADAGDYPEGEVLELYRIRGRAAWKELKIAAIEASILSETLLRKYGAEILRRNGYSNNKVKRLKDELTFNTLLNIVLPLSLSKTELKATLRHIDAVDVLRGIRNDLVHGNITERDLDARVIDRTIESAIRLVRLMQAKI